MLYTACMVRQYCWNFNVRSYEVDPWGQVPAAGILRYFEHSAVAAAADAGYGNDFHRQNNSAWVIRRMALLINGSIRSGHELEITTWLSHFVRVRGGREYRLRNLTTGEDVASGLAEWVYMNRTTMSPMQIPREMATGFETPGKPLYEYVAPVVEPEIEIASPSSVVERTAEWHECDSFGHVNNANYVGWLDDAFLDALEANGKPAAQLHHEGLAPRGVYYKLDYKRAALPRDTLQIATGISAVSGRSYAVNQTISLLSGEDVLDARSVYSLEGTSRQAKNPNNP